MFRVVVNAEAQYSIGAGRGGEAPLVGVPVNSPRARQECLNYRPGVDGHTTAEYATEGDDR
jgi:hypothetical protein